MSYLFQIESRRVQLTWRVHGNVAAAVPRPGGAGWEGDGHLRVDASSASDVRVARGIGAPLGTGDLDSDHGPALFEEGRYTVFVAAKEGVEVELRHADPALLASFAHEQGRKVHHGTLSFRSHIGRSAFEVWVGGRRELGFEVEVFPTKLNYREDYEKLLSEVQQAFGAMALAYLRATHQGARRTPKVRPSELEWVLLLGESAGRLEQGLEHLRRQPRWALAREPVWTRADAVRAVDSALRQAVRRRAGRGALVQLAGDLAVRERLVERRARPTLDTPEHRWLAAQATGVQRRLAGIIASERRALKDTRSRCGRARRESLVARLVAIEEMMTRHLRTEPLAAAAGPAPAGFASLQLIGAPGYREAYRGFVDLLLGLIVADRSTLEVSTRDLARLYELWCFLTVVKTVSEVTKEPFDVTELVEVKERGLALTLARLGGRGTSMSLRDGRTLSVRYQQKFAAEGYVLSQQPDIVLTIEGAGWPTTHLILDAKYRVDATPEYRQQFGAPGPPADALNELHRYRDAIVSAEGSPDGDGQRFSRTVVLAAALFPAAEGVGGEEGFEQGELWKQLERHGVGAIPLLPGATRLLGEWLRRALGEGPWRLADRAIPSAAYVRREHWRDAAAQAVALRSASAVARAQVAKEGEWVERLSPHQPRQLGARWLAFYTPGVGGRVTHVAEIVEREVDRSGSEALEVRWRLGPLREIAGPAWAAAQGIPAWTTLLALHRAGELPELYLETEQEWRLYESMRAQGAQVRIERLPPASLESARGRCWLELDDGRAVRYAGAAGFEVRTPGRANSTWKALDAAIVALKG